MASLLRMPDLSCKTTDTHRGSHPFWLLTMKFNFIFILHFLSLLYSKLESLHWSPYFKTFSHSNPGAERKLWNSIIFTQFGEIHDSWHCPSLLSLLVLRLHFLLYFCLCLTKSLAYCIFAKISIKHFFSNFNAHTTPWQSSRSSDSASVGLRRGLRVCRLAAPRSCPCYKSKDLTLSRKDFKDRCQDQLQNQT